MPSRKKVLHPKLPQLAGYKVKDLLTKAAQAPQATPTPQQQRAPQQQKAPKHPIGQVFQTSTPNFCMVTRQDPADPNSTQTVRASCDPNKAQEATGGGEGGQPTQQVTPPEVGQSPVAKTQEGTGEGNAQNQATKEPLTFDNWFTGLTDTPEDQSGTDQGDWFASTIDVPEGQDETNYDNWAEDLLDNPEEAQAEAQPELGDEEGENTDILYEYPKEDWTDPTKRDLLPINLTSKKQKDASSHLWNQISQSNITNNNKTLYSNYLDSIITNIPDRALENMLDNLGGTSVFKNTGAEVVDGWLEFYKGRPGYSQVAGEYEKVADELKKQGAAGLYSPDQKALIVDGGEEFSDPGYQSYTSRGLYAHELTHAIDAGGNNYSNQDGWKSAFEKELREGQLCDYAAKSELEGFAEFGRLLYAGEHYHEHVKKAFPLSFAFWEKMGLVKPQEFHQAKKRTKREQQQVPQTKRLKTKSIKPSPFYKTKSLSRRVQGGHYSEQGAFIPDGIPFLSERGGCRVIQQTSHRNVPATGCGTSGRSEVKNPQLAGRGEEKTPDYAALKDKMRTMEIVDVVDLTEEEVGEHKNVTKIVTYSDGNKGVYKPEYGEDPRFAEHNVYGRLYAREAANSDIADLVKMSDLHPPTVVRDVDGQRGSIQLYVDGTLPAAGYGEIEHTDPSVHPDRYIDPFHPRYDGDKDLARAGALDYLTGQQDRHLGNWLLDKNGKLVLIDNGDTFPNSANNSIGPSYLTDVARERNLAIPEEVRHWKWDDIHSILKKYEFSREEIAHTKERFRDLQKSTTFAGLAESMKVRLKRDKLEQLRENLRTMRARKPRAPVLSQSQHPASQEPLAATNLQRTNLERR